MKSLKSKKIIVFAYTIDGSGSSQVLYRLLDGLKDIYEFELISLYGGEVEERLKLLGIKVRSFIQKKKGINGIDRINFFFYSFRRIVSFNVKSGFILLNTSRNLWPSIVSRLCNKKMILIAHETPHHYSKNSLKRISVINTAIFSNKIIAVSNYVKISFSKIKSLENKEIELIYNGLDNKRVIKISEESVCPELLQKISGKKVLGQVGLITPIKNTSHLVSLLAQLNRGNTGYFLLIVGSFNDKNYESQIVDQIKSLGLIDNFYITGYTNNVYKYLKLMQVVYIVSRIETFGLVALEAMFLDKPIIANDLNAIIEILGEDYPFILDTSNKEKLKEASLNLIYNDDIQERIRTLYKKRKNLFTLDHFINEYKIMFEQFYDSL